MTTMGKLIRNMRESAKLSQKQLADILGVSASMIGQYENDIRKPKIETLQRIAEALGTSITINLDRKTGTVRYALFHNGIKHPSTVQRTDPSCLYTVNIEYDGGTSDIPAEIGGKWVSSLLNAFSQLNDDGQTKAVERVEELTEIPKYQKEPPQD